MFNANSKVLRPNNGMKMSPAAKMSMRQTEKAIYRYYNDMGKNKGNCTWGVGILAHKGVCTQEELGRRVSVGLVNLEYERRVAEVEGIVRRRVTVALDQNQFDALCSLVYNAGEKEASDTFRFINQGNFSGAANNISLLIKVGITENGKKRYVVAPGLIKRRAEESAPFRVNNVAAAKE